MYTFLRIQYYVRRDKLKGLNVCKRFYKPFNEKLLIVHLLLRDKYS